MLIDVEVEELEPEDEEDEAKASTIFSRSTRGKKSQITLRSASKSHAASARKGAKSMAKTAKKTADIKSGGSALSKVSNSRMSRASVRVTKTIKSKQSKSIFVQREEDPAPEQLNCAHYERLLRIHAMLAMIVDGQEQQVQYALDAKFFLSKIFEISFKTLNQIEENAARYTNIIDEKSGRQVPAQGQPKPAQQEAADPFVPK